MKYLTIFFSTLCILCIICVPAMVHAQTPPASATPATQTPSTSTVKQNTNSAATASGFALAVKIDNPLKVNTIGEAVALLVRTIIKLALPVIVLFFIWSGLKLILAMGNEREITKAKDMFFYTVIGTLLILGAWTITNVIIGTVNTIAN